MTGDRGSVGASLTWRGLLKRAWAVLVSRLRPVPRHCAGCYETEQLVPADDGQSWRCVECRHVGRLVHYGLAGRSGLLARREQQELQAIRYQRARSHELHRHD